MKTQPSNDVGERGRHANYSKEYIREALELWRNSGRSATVVAAELGIRRPLLYRWATAQRPPDGSSEKSGQAQHHSSTIQPHPPRPLFSSPNISFSMRMSGEGARGGRQPVG